MPIEGTADLITCEWTETLLNLEEGLFQTVGAAAEHRGYAAVANQPGRIRDRSEAGGLALIEGDVGPPQAVLDGAEARWRVRHGVAEQQRGRAAGPVLGQP